jgi:hypothetical protein
MGGWAPRTANSQSRTVLRTRDHVTCWRIYLCSFLICSTVILIMQFLNLCAKGNDARTPKSVGMKHCFRMNLLYRLRWDLLADLHDIKIAVGPENEESVVPLFGQPCMDEDIAELGLSCIETCSDECFARYEKVVRRKPRARRLSSPTFSHYQGRRWRVHHTREVYY